VVKAARLVAEDALTDEQIAAKVGISERQLERWKRQPAFSELVPEIADKLAAAIRGKGLVELENRVDAPTQPLDSQLLESAGQRAQDAER
jgi:hypothetical protein